MPEAEKSPTGALPPGQKPQEEGRDTTKNNLAGRKSKNPALESGSENYKGESTPKAVSFRLSKKDKNSSSPREPSMIVRPKSPAITDQSSNLSPKQAAAVESPPKSPKNSDISPKKGYDFVTASPPKPRSPDHPKSVPGSKPKSVGTYSGKVNKDGNDSNLPAEPTVMVAVSARVKAKEGAGSVKQCSNDVLQNLPDEQVDESAYLSDKKLPESGMGESAMDSPDLVVTSLPETDHLCSTDKPVLENGHRPAASSDPTSASNKTATPPGSEEKPASGIHLEQEADQQGPLDHSVFPPSSFDEPLSPLLLSNRNTAAGTSQMKPLKPTLLPSPGSSFPRFSPPVLDPIPKISSTRSSLSFGPIVSARPQSKIAVSMASPPKPLVAEINYQKSPSKSLPAPQGSLKRVGSLIGHLTPRTPSFVRPSEIKSPRLEVSP